MLSKEAKGELLKLIKYYLEIQEFHDSYDCLERLEV